MLSFTKKTNEPIPTKCTDRGKDRQTLFYSILAAEAGDSTISLQQVTCGNTPNLVLKRMLRYFLKIAPLKKILQF